MENLQIQMNTGIKLVDIANERGEVVCTLKINTADARTAERFGNLIQSLNSVGEDFENRAKALDEKYESDCFDKTIETCGLHVDYLQKCSDEIDSIFGEGTIKSIYRECYEVNPDFVPDEEMLTEFVGKIIPVMNTVFNERFENNRKKYNVARKGKNK